MRLRPRAPRVALRPAMLVRAALTPARLLPVALLPVALSGQVSPPTLDHDDGWSVRALAPAATAYRIHSDVLGESRRIFVALPPSHGATERDYPLVLVFDGESVLGPVLGSASALWRAGHMPEAVVVAIENTDRLRDLSPPGLPVSGNGGRGRADAFVRFLDQELVPALERRFRVRDVVTLVGHSSGGLFVHYALAARPDRFGLGLALDAPMHLGEGEAAEPLIEAARSGEASIRLVSSEARFGWLDPDWERLVEAARNGWALDRHALPNESHLSMVVPASYEGLRRLFDHFSTVGADRGPIDLLADFDSRGFDPDVMPPPRALLGAAVEDHLSLVDAESARATLERMEAAYGRSRETVDLWGRIDAAEGSAIEGPTLAELQATPLPSAATVRHLLGDWTGYTVMEGTGVRSPLALELRDDGGRVAGLFRFAQGPGHEVEYLLVDDERVHIGYMNRMNPRGMLLYEGVVEDDVFEGEFVLRGIVFRMPDGRPLPTTRFHLERVGSGVHDPTVRGPLSAVR